MNNLSQYIIEKLHINKDTKVGYTTAKQIAEELFDHIKIDKDEYKNVIDAICKWTSEINFTSNFDEANIIISSDNHECKYWFNNEFAKKIQISRRDIEYFLKENFEKIYSYKSGLVTLSKFKKDILFSFNGLGGAFFHLLIRYQPYGELG